MVRYDAQIDAAAINTSHGLMLALIPSDARVLDIGCATGYLARELRDRGCVVSGVESDPEAAEEARPVLDRLVVGDLETLDLVAEFGAGGFDAVVLGDVLEHLREPDRVLAGVRPLLAPGGCVVVSLPNVAHAAVRFALLKGEWTYRDRGLLDRTHLRFFTRAGLEDLVHRTGFVAVDRRRTTAGPFDTELGVRPDDVPAGLVEEVLRDDDALTYQFVWRLVPIDSAPAHALLGAQIDELERRLAAAQARADEAARVASTAVAEREALSARLADWEATRLVRWSAAPRQLYRAARRRSGRPA